MKESEGFEPCSLDGNSTSFVGWESKDGNGSDAADLPLLGSLHSQTPSLI